MIVELPPGFWLNTVDSTMDEARRLIQAGQIHGTAFIVANHQSTGRGTQGRRWESPDQAGVYLSVVHLPTTEQCFETTTLYTLAAGIACIEALQQVTEVQAMLKPVNDLYVSGRKLGGILVESELQQAGIASLITGIGINTHHVERDLDRETVSPISLEELLPAEVFATLSVETLVETLVAKICFWYALIFHGQTGQVQRTWERYCIPA